MSNIKITKKTILTIATSVAFVLLCLFLCSCANNQTSENKDHATLTSQILDDTTNLKSFGSLDVDISPEEFLKHYSLGDIVDIKIEGLDNTLTMPVCSSYDDVSPGEFVLRAKEGEEYITLAITYGQLGVQYGFLQHNAENSPVKYSVVSGKLPCSATITLREEGTFKERLKVGQLHESGERIAYPELSDDQFANFRDAKCGSIRSGVLYRSTSPIDPKVGRNTYADDACRNNKIVSALNLQDSEQEARSFPGFDETYYSTIKVKYLKMNMALGTNEFNKNMASSLRYIIENDGPYLIHCVYGKDRTGIVCAVLEGLCGASKNEICEDYRQTYTNLYDVVDDEQVALDSDILSTVDQLIITNLNYAYKTEVNESNINQKTEEYVKSIGLSQDEINQIRQKLK